MRKAYAFFHRGCINSTNDHFQEVAYKTIDPIAMLNEIFERCIVQLASKFTVELSSYLVTYVRTHIFSVVEI